MNTSIFILDDHEIVRRGLRSLLEAQPDLDVVGEAGTAQEATTMVPALRPDVALLDLRLPDGSGIDVCRHLLPIVPGLRCVIYSGQVDRATLREAVRARVSGVLLKSTSERELIAAIRRVAAGDVVLDRSLAHVALEEVLRPDSSNDPFAPLTAQETRIAALVVEGKSNRQIAQELTLSQQTVKNYLSNMLRKLGLAHRTQLALWAARREITGNGQNL